MRGKKKRVVLIVLLLMIGTLAFAGGQKEATEEPAAADGAAAPVDTVSLRVNWLWYGSHGIFFLGKEKGFYEDENINLVLKEGNGSANGVRLVANKEDTFAYGASATMINLAARGAPVISVAVIDAEGVDAVFCRPDSGIKTFKDLEGKKVLTTASAGTNLFFGVAAKNGGADVNKIELMNVAEGAKLTSYLQGLAPCTLGGLDDVPAEIEANGGEPPIAIPYSDYGVYQPGYSIVAHKDLIAKNPDLVRRFVKATIKSVEAAQADPDAVVQAMLKAGVVENTPAELKRMRQVLDVTLSILISDNNKDQKVGLHVAEDWKSVLSLLKEFTDLDTEIPYSSFYTNDFIP